MNRIQWKSLQVLSLFFIVLSLSNCTNCDENCFKGGGDVVVNNPETNVPATDDVVKKDDPTPIDDVVVVTNENDKNVRDDGWQSGDKGFNNSFDTGDGSGDNGSGDGSGDNGSGDGSGDNGSGDESGDVEIVDIADDEDPKSPSACDGRSNTVKTVHRVVFPERLGCSYGEGENLTKKNLSVRAYAAQKVNIDLPKDVEVCRMEYVTRSEEFYHDDFIFLMMNDNLMTMSQGRFSSRLNEQDGLLKWSFPEFRDASQNLSGSWFSESKPWCLEGTSCEVPSTEETGVFSFSGNLLANKSLTKSLAKSSGFELKMVTTGDNDSYDCHHTGLEFDLIIETFEK